MATKIVKPKGLSKRGIDKLEKLMIVNKRSYDQDKFGEVTECNTFMCAAGIAYFAEVGKEQFEREAKRAERGSRAFNKRCVLAGKRLLKIDTPGSALPQIFRSPFEWPMDARQYFDKARGPLDRVNRYIKILRTRALADGSFPSLEQD